MISFSKAFSNLFHDEVGELNDAIFDAITELFLSHDFGLETSQSLTQSIREKAPKMGLSKAFQASLLASLPKPIKLQKNTKPVIWLLLGVNGTGKTTTLAKLANRFQASGEQVMLAAGDTFRAAAVAQLQRWGETANVPVIAQATGADSAAVIFDAIGAAQARQIDTLLIDTAGRLHTQDNLIEEMKRVIRVIRKKIPEAPHHCLLVLDATMGQNNLAQALAFTQDLPVNGLIFTKLDSNPRSGSLFATLSGVSLPIYFTSNGESITNLTPFDPQSFVQDLCQHIHIR